MTPAAELRPVKGPSALGGGWRRFCELLYLISVNEFKKTYFDRPRYVWSVLRPCSSSGAPSSHQDSPRRLGVPHYPVMLLLDIVLFGFFQEATTQP
jgi:ABC-2 type transport system permease protein